MNNTKTIIILALLLMLVAFIGGIFTHKALSKEEPLPPETIIVPQIEYVDSPFPVSREPAPDSIPSITIKKEDILPTEDTTSVQVRPTVSTFTDTLPSGASYKIQASGIGTSIESIALSWPQRETVIREPYRGWSIDLVGQGTLTDFSMAGVTAFAGLQVGYNSDRFDFGIGPGALWSRPPGAASHKTSLAVMATLKVRLHRFR